MTYYVHQSENTSFIVREVLRRPIVPDSLEINDHMNLHNTDDNSENFLGKLMTNSTTTTKRTTKRTTERTTGNTTQNNNFTKKSQRVDLTCITVLYNVSMLHFLNWFDEVQKQSLRSEIEYMVILFPETNCPEINVVTKSLLSGLPRSILFEIDDPTVSLYETWNFAIPQSSSEYVSTFHPDDRRGPDWAAQMLRTIVLNIDEKNHYQRPDLVTPMYRPFRFVKDKDILKSENKTFAVSQQALKFLESGVRLFVSDVFPHCTSCETLKIDVGPNLWFVRQQQNTDNMNDTNGMDDMDEINDTDKTQFANNNDSSKKQFKTRVITMNDMFQKLPVQFKKEHENNLKLSKLSNLHKSMFYTARSVPNSCPVFRKDLLNEEKFNESQNVPADFEFWISAIARGKRFLQCTDVVCGFAISERQLHRKHSFSRKHWASLLSKFFT